MSAPMVRAILDDKKTQTRRIVKPQPYFLGGPAFESPEMDVGVSVRTDTGKLTAYVANDDCGDMAGAWEVPSPYGRPGDRLWVRETWQPMRMQSTGEMAKTAAIVERFQTGQIRDVVAGAAELSQVGRTGDVTCLYAADFGEWAYSADSDLKPWKPSIFMPRRFSRLTLEITKIRVERLQDISAADALAEGVQVPVKEVGIPCKPLLCISGTVRSHKLWADNKNATGDDWLTGYYALLWNEINGKKAPWDSNPWVWVIEFKRVGGLN